MDYNATTPIFPEVTAAMQPFTFELFGNPSSTHAHGRKTAAAVADARAAVATMVGAASAEEIYFCACGTEADNWAIWGAVAAARQRARQPAEAQISSSSTPVAAAAAAGAGLTTFDQAQRLPHVVTSTVEHPAILACLEALADQGLCSYTAVGVDSEGLVSADTVRAAMRPGETVLVSIMHSNNEVGSIQPIREIARIAREGGALVHSDAAQSIGKVSWGGWGLEKRGVFAVEGRAMSTVGVGGAVVDGGLCWPNQTLAHLWVCSAADPSKPLTPCIMQHNTHRCLSMFRTWVSTC